MADFVLIHGGCHGGWCWRKVADRLIAAGHRVYAPTLTGLAEWNEEPDPRICLSTHIDEVAALARSEQLEGFVLCGHSYGGMVISGVAEQLQGKIAAIVYLDALNPTDGDTVGSLTGFIPPAVRASLPPHAAMFNLRDPDDVLEVDARMNPHPTACVTERVKFTGAYERIPVKVYVHAAGWRSFPHLASNYRRTSGDASWRAVSFPCGHHVMMDLPDEVSVILQEAAIAAGGKMS